MAPSSETKKPVVAGGRRSLKLPRETRLVSGKDYSRAYSKGARARGDVLTLVVCPNGLGITRMGLSVGKRCWKHAVRRNRVCRVFREAFRLSRHELPEGFDLVMIGAVPRLSPKLDETKRELVALMQRALRKLERKKHGAAGTRR